MSYPKIKLGDCAEIYSGSTPRTNIKEYWDGDIVWVTPKDLSKLNSKFIQVTENKITKLGFDSCSTKMLPENSVLFSSRAPIGYVAITRIPLCTNQGFKSFVPHKEKLDSEYLYYWLKSNKEYLQDLGVGATFKEISKTIISNVEIPLPLLPEQRRIAAILDKAEELRQKRKQAIAKFDQLLQATFIEMFGDPVTNPKGWPLNQTLGDLTDIVSGITKGRKPSTTDLTEIPYLAVVNVQDKYLNLTTIKTIEATENEITKYLLKKGDLLLTEGGDPDKLGRGTLWNNEIERCIHQNHVFRVRLKTNLVTPNYLNWFVASEFGKRYFLRQAKQTTGIATINMGQLKKLPLLIPPIAIQHKFDSICKSIIIEKSSLTNSLVKIEKLFQSLQNQAFNGTL